MLVGAEKCRSVINKQQTGTGIVLAPPGWSRSRPRPRSRSRHRPRPRSVGSDRSVVLNDSREPDDSDFWFYGFEVLPQVLR